MIKQLVDSPKQKSNSWFKENSSFTLHNSCDKIGNVQPNSTFSDISCLDCGFDTHTIFEGEKKFTTCKICGWKEELPIDNPRDILLGKLLLKYPNLPQNLTQNVADEIHPLAIDVKDLCEETQKFSTGRSYRPKARKPNQERTSRALFENNGFCLSCEAIAQPWGYYRGRRRFRCQFCNRTHSPVVDYVYRPRLDLRAPKFTTRTPVNLAAAKNKSRKWALKQKAAGLCPRCGKNAHPFVLCEICREKERMRHKK